MENFSRRLRDMYPVLLEKPDDNPNRVIYDVQRGKDTKNNLRYDITFLYPKSLGKELPKTYGHYHKNGMVEIMDVIKGKVWWLLQKYENNPKIVTEAYLVEAKEKESVIFPPNFGVISINPIDQNSTMSNWLSPKMESDYKPYTQLHGACYYIYKNGNKINFEKNKNYEQVPELIHLAPKEIPELNITFNKPLSDFSEKELEFLNNPKKYKNILTIKKCYDKI